MTATNLHLRVRLVTRHCPAANNSFSKDWDRDHQPLACQTERTKLCLTSISTGDQATWRGRLHINNLYKYVLRYHFYNLFQLNKLESLLEWLPCNQLASSFWPIKCGPLINNFSIHKINSLHPKLNIEWKQEFKLEMPKCRHVFHSQTPHNHLMDEYVLGKNAAD